MTLLRSLAAGAVLLAAGAVSATAQTYTLGDLTIENPWVRAMPPAADAGGGFLTITNHGTADDVLIAAASPVAGRMEIHTMDMTSGVMRMRELEDGLPIPAGETVELAPGGFHVMFLDLPAPIAEGPPIPVTLTFEHAGQITIDMIVAPPGAPGPTMEMDGMPERAAP